MRCLALALILCSLAAFANAACDTTLKEVESQDPCQDAADKDLHEVDSSWTNSQCMECSCDTAGMACCDLMWKPDSLPDECEVLYDWKQCTYEVVEKNDHSAPCPLATELGK